MRITHCSYYAKSMVIAAVRISLEEGVEDMQGMSLTCRYVCLLDEDRSPLRVHLMIDGEF